MINKYAELLSLDLQLRKIHLFDANLELIQAETLLNYSEYIS